MAFLTQEKKFIMLEGSAVSTIALGNKPPRSVWLYVIRRVWFGLLKWEVDTKLQHIPLNETANFPHNMLRASMYACMCVD